MPAAWPWSAGPIVYCLEDVDHAGHVHNIVIPGTRTAWLRASNDLPRRRDGVSGKAQAVRRNAEGQMTCEPMRLYGRAVLCLEPSWPGRDGRLDRPHCRESGPLTAAWKFIHKAHKARSVT